MSRLVAWVSRHRVLSTVLALAVLIGGYLGYHGVRTYVAWRSVDRVSFDVAGSREVLAGLTTTTVAGASTIPVVPVDPLADGEVAAYLVIGSDERPEGIGLPQEGIYADGVLLYLDPADEDPAMVSLPRDLLVTDPCRGGVAKLSTLLEGCQTQVSGPELLAIAVEDFTGIAIDHFAVVRFDALVEVIDGLGGVDLCVPRALQYAPGRDLLPQGCSRADGLTTLRYVRSRTTLELVDGEWQAITGESDLTRAQRQQSVLLAMLTRAKTLRTPGQLADLVESLDDGALVLDKTLSMTEALSLAWKLRGTPTGSIRRLVLPVEATVTADGHYAVVATSTVRELLAES